MVAEISKNGLWRIERENVPPPEGSFADECWEIRLVHVPSNKVMLSYSGESMDRVGHGNWDTEWSRGIDNLVFTPEQDRLLLLDVNGSETLLDFPAV